MYSAFQIYEDSIKLGTVFTYARETLEKTGLLPPLPRSDDQTGENNEDGEVLAQNDESKASVEEMEDDEPGEECKKLFCDVTHRQ